MVKDKSVHGNRAKGRNKGSRKVVNFGQEEILMRKELSTNMNQLCDQRRNMNFNESEHFVNNKGNKVLIKDFIFEKDFRGLQDLGIDKVFVYKEVRTTKISQHISHKFDLSHMDWIIKGKAGGQDGDPPNFWTTYSGSEEEVEEEYWI